MSDSPTPLKVLGLHHVGWAVEEVEKGVYTLLAHHYQPIDRPDLGFPGAWLQRNRVVIHLLEGEPGDQLSLRFLTSGVDITCGIHDVSASASFFAEVLGLESAAVETPDSTNAKRLTLSDLPPVIRVELGENSLYLIGDGPRRSASAPNSRGDHIAFGVSDIDAAERWLKHCGVNHVRKTQRGSGIEQIFLVDPDDHTIELNPSPMP